MNDTKPQNNSLTEQILKKIEVGEVSMKPKAYFIARVGLLMFVLVLTFLTSALLISYILFSIKAGGKIFLLGFGTRGLFEFVLMFPWLLLVINVILLLFLDSLLKHFKFAYNRPILYLFLGTLVVITLFGSLINFTPFHGSMMHRAEKRSLPMFGSLYSDIRKSHRENGIFRGIVATVSTSTFTIRHNDYDIDVDDSQLKVFTPSNVDISGLLHIGDEVFVAGDVINSEIHAYGIKKLDIND